MNLKKVRADALTKSNLQKHLFWQADWSVAQSSKGEKSRKIIKDILKTSPTPYIFPKYM